MNPLARGNLAAGNFFFRVRNQVFPILFLLVPLVARPRWFFHDPSLDALVRWAGVVIALGGAAVRLATIGFDYIERGGKEGKVWRNKINLLALQTSAINFSTTSHLPSPANKNGHLSDEAFQA